MTDAAAKDHDENALAFRDGLARLIAWRDEGRLLHAHFARNFLTGAITTVTLRAEIASIDSLSIKLRFDGGGLRSMLAEAEIFEGPMTFIDVRSKRREDIEAVQVKLRGGDSLILSTREIAEVELTQLAVRRLPAPLKDE
ncbi:MAG TPA: hypothetical protein VNH64_08990 [Parvularculaceae bacterium]|nr:hypothetical protein [Parvularculaceae bacterium]